MNKKAILGILVGLDLLLAIVFAATLFQASEAMTWAFYEKKSIRPDDILSYMDRENYGVVAILARSGRVGEKVSAEDEDLYLLGEYADLLFWQKIQETEGNQTAASECTARLAEIRKSLGGYEVLFDKMDQSIVDAVRE